MTEEEEGTMTGATAEVAVTTMIAVDGTTTVGVTMTVVDGTMAAEEVGRGTTMVEEGGLTVRRTSREGTGAAALRLRGRGEGGRGSPRRTWGGRGSPCPVSLSRRRRRRG